MIRVMILIPSINNDAEPLGFRIRPGAYGCGVGCLQKVPLSTEPVFLSFRAPGSPTDRIADSDLFIRIDLRRSPP